MMTQSTFNDLEALEIAIEIEKRGKKFYSMADVYAPDEEVKRMLADLAKQEEEHASTFENIYNELLKNKDQYDDAYLFEPDVAAYLHAIVESTIFPDKEKQDAVIQGIKSITDVFFLGIQAEKDSILFYTEMVIHSKLLEAKEAFRKLIMEEKKHLLDLQEKYLLYKNKEQ